MEDAIEKIVSFAKRRGFIFPSSDIYGGLSGFYDFGPLGVELQRNIKRSWWKNIVWDRENVFGIDSTIIFNPRTWEASGHVQTFTDPLTECKKCHRRFRADHLVRDAVAEGKIEGYESLNEGNMEEIKEALSKVKCPDCGGELMPPRNFNLMFKTFVGPVEATETTAFLRPETAQGIFLNYKNVLDSQRVKVPFGIAQTGKAFRNEINPRNFIFRIREFEQMEMEYFVEPGKEEEAFNYWIKERMDWYINDLGIKKDNLRVRHHQKDELSHYAKACVDIEYKFPSLGWDEIEGIANRTDFDLKQHQEYSGEDLRYFDDEKNKYYLPFVVEPSCGVERVLFALLCEGYTEVEGGRTTTTEATKKVERVLKINKKIAPIKVAVFPLLKNKPGLVEKAKEVYEMVKKKFPSQYDESGSIGRRYRRADEVGIPFGVTIDFDTLEKEDVTIRDRDTMEQERVKISELISIIKEKLN